MARSNATKRYITELSILKDLAQTLNQALDLRTALDGALSHIVELLGLQSGWVFLLSDAETFTLAARHNLPPAITYPGVAWKGDCDCQDLCREGKLDRAVSMIVCSRLQRAVGDKRGLAQHASVPLQSGEEVLGILNIATTAWSDFSPAEMHLLTTVGSMLSTAIARARLYEQVKVRRVQEQGALLRLSQELLVAEELEPALQRLVRVGARLLEADACAFVEADEVDNRAVLRAAYGWQLPEESAWPLILDTTTAHLWYLPEQACDLPREALADLPGLLRQQHFLGHRAIFVELGGVPIGTLMVNTHSTRQFLEDETQLLGLLANQLAQTLERERLHQEALERHRLEQELDFARTIQESFLPNTCPRVPGYAIAAYYRAARQVGGDFYDFIELPDATALPDDASAPSGALERPVASPVSTEAPTGQGPAMPMARTRRLGMVIADVTDKGVPAALFMALSRTLLRATASDGRAPAEVLEQANRLILADARAGLFVTCFYALLDLATGLVTYANGGHNYPLLCRRATGDVEPLRAQGIVLGIIPQPRFEQRGLTLHPGDVLLFYTDGVTEAMNAQRELLGEDRLIEVLRRHSRCGPQQIIEAVLDAIHAFVDGQPQSDDMTMVVIQRLEG